VRTDAILGTFMFLAFVAWVLVEFLGLMYFLSRLFAKLGMSDRHESVDVTVQHMDDWPYAATRNASQQRKNGGH
jgi:hypothetical protein